MFAKVYRGTGALIPAKSAGSKKNWRKRKERERKMSESLKRIGENLSKSWKVERTHEPFYDGKKGVCNKSLTKYYSLYNENLLILTWPSGTS